jgi:signal transduction histidine kinase
MIVPDYYNSPYSYLKVDDQTEHTTRNMLDVPIQLQDRMIGVLCAVNKKEREFDQEDVYQMTTIASTVALPIENARINDELKRSYEEVQSLNRAKDRVIHHLSHELKTPVSVLSATLHQLENQYRPAEKKKIQRLLDRMMRNLSRILEMQYEIEDILREKDYPSHQMLSTLLDVCADELEVLVAHNLPEADIVEKIRQQIDEIFGPHESVPEETSLSGFVQTSLPEIQQAFSHRSCELVSRFAPVGMILIPPEVLEKLIVGLVKNAVENTPDGGRISVTVKTGNAGPELIVADTGVGITPENRKLIFESNFSAKDTLQYSSKNPFDFNAGGKGFDLLRMRIFSERYAFKIQMQSKRCRHIPTDADQCPGRIEDCTFCKIKKDCFQSGGTTVTVRFQPADMAK